MAERVAQIEFLRKHAKRLREIAVSQKTMVSPELLKMAEDIDARIARLEDRGEAQ
jgi:hypothetical protein